MKWQTAPQLVEPVLDRRAGERDAEAARAARTPRAPTWLSGFLIACASSRTTVSQRLRRQELARRGAGRRSVVSVTSASRIERAARPVVDRDRAGRGGSARSPPPSCGARWSGQTTSVRPAHARRAPAASCRGPCRRRAPRRARRRAGRRASRRRACWYGRSSPSRPAGQRRVRDALEPCSRAARRRAGAAAGARRIELVAQGREVGQRDARDPAARRRARRADRRRARRGGRATRPAAAPSRRPRAARDRAPSCQAAPTEAAEARPRLGRVLALAGRGLEPEVEAGLAVRLVDQR